MRELKRILERLNQLRGLRKIKDPRPQIFEDTSAPVEDTAIPNEVESETTKQIYGIPRQLKKALAVARESAPTVRPNKGLPREDMRAALIALREKIEAEFPSADPSHGLLRQNMLEELPMDADEWRAKVALDLRQGTDGEQFKRYAVEVFEVLAG